MPRPTVGDVHVDAILDAFSIAYKNDTYIGSQILPYVDVQKQSDKYFVFDRSSWFRDRSDIRAPGTRAKRNEYALSTASYFCNPYAVATPVPDEVVRNADAPLRPAIEAAEFSTDGILLGLEIRVANLVTASGNWTSASNKSGSGWSNPAAEPLVHIETAVDAVISNIGRRPNTIAMSWNIWRILKNHPDLIDRVKYTRPGGTPRVADLGEIFGFDRTLVGTALKDTAQAGATAAISYVWGNNVWVGYVPSTPGLMTPAAGYVVRWGTRSTEVFREAQEKQNVYAVEEHTDEIISASEAGAVLANVQ